MKSIPAVIATVVLLLGFVTAQNAPTWEVSSGYLRDVHIGCGSADGYTVGVQGNVNRWVGGVFDFGDSFSSYAGVHQRFTTFMAGPQFTYRTDARLQPFVRVLIGGAHGKASDSGPYDTNVAVGGGAGFDVRINHNMYFRTKADFIHTSLLQENSQYIQPSAGFVYHFGGNAGSRH